MRIVQKFTGGNTVTIPSDGAYSIIVTSVGYAEHQGIPPVFDRPIYGLWVNGDSGDYLTFAHVERAYEENTYGFSCPAGLPPYDYHVHTSAQATIERLDNVPAGTHTLVKAIGTVSSGYIYVVQGAQVGGQTVSATGPKQNYVFAPPTPMVRDGGVIVGVARPYRLVEGTFPGGFSWYYNVSPRETDDSSGSYAKTVSRKTPGYTASWSATSSGGVYCALWMEGASSIPLFAMF
jgi:hypothetical protein